MYPWGVDTFRWFNTRDPLIIASNPNYDPDTIGYPWIDCNTPDTMAVVLPFSASYEENDTIRIHAEFTLPRDNLDRYGLLTFAWQRNSQLNIWGSGNQFAHDTMYILVLTGSNLSGPWDTVLTYYLGSGGNLVTTPDTCGMGWKVESLYVVPTNCCPLDTIVRIEFMGITAGNGADFWLDHVVLEELPWSSSPRIQLLSASVPFRAGNDLCDPYGTWTDQISFKIQNPDPLKPLLGSCAGCEFILRATNNYETVDLDTIATVGPLCPGDSAYLVFTWPTSKLHFQENYRFDVVYDCPSCATETIITSVGSYVLKDPYVYLAEDFEYADFLAQDSIPLGWERIVVNNEHDYAFSDTLYVISFDTYKRDSFYYWAFCPARPFWKLGPFNACGSNEATPVDPSSPDPPNCDTLQGEYCWTFDAGSPDDSLDLSFSYIVTFESDSCCNGPKYPELEYMFWMAGSDTVEIRVYGVRGYTLEKFAYRVYGSVSSDSCWIHGVLPLYQCPQLSDFAYDSIVVAFVSKSTEDRSNPGFDYVFLKENMNRIDVSPIDLTSGYKWWQYENYHISYDCMLDSIVYDPSDEGIYVTVQNNGPSVADSFQILLLDSTDQHGWMTAGSWIATVAVEPCGGTQTYLLDWQPIEEGCHWLKVATEDFRDCYVSNDTLHDKVLEVYVFKNDAQLVALEGGFEEKDAILTLEGLYFLNTKAPPGYDTLSLDSLLALHAVSWYAPIYPGFVYWETHVHEDSANLDFNPPVAFNGDHYARFRTHEIGIPGNWAMQSYIIVDFSTIDTTLRGHLRFRYWNPDGTDYLTVEWIECEPGQNVPPPPDDPGWHEALYLTNGGSWEPFGCSKGWMDVDIDLDDWTGLRIWIQFVAHKDYPGQDPSNIAIDGVEAFLAPPNQFIAGDCNGDGQVNGSDLVYLANYLFSGGPPPDPILTGDTNGDCIVNTSDLVYFAVYLYGGGPPPNGCNNQFVFKKLSKNLLEPKKSAFKHPINLNK
jgi:hypothetical protein